MSGLMAGKRGLIMGVANEHSIAWGCARALAREGARLAFSYQSVKAEPFVLPLFSEVDTACSGVLDVTDEAAIEVFVGEAARRLGGQVDFLVHAVAGGPRKGELGGGVLNMSAEGMADSMRISVLSLNLALRHLKPYLARGSAAVTFTYLGSRRVMPAYDVMGLAKAALDANVRYLAAELGPEGIRVNAIESGSLMTRAAGGIRDYERVVDGTRSRSPLRAELTADALGDAALFLLSDLARMVTGQILTVDGGYSILGF